MSSMLKPPKPVSRRQELREDAVVTTYAKTITLAEKYRGALIAAGVAIVAIFLGVAGWTYYQAGQSDRADEALGAILPLFEAGSYQEALDGTADTPGLLAVADEYGSSEAGNLAEFYAASALFQLGRYEEAGDYFASYDGGEDVFGAAAIAGEAAVAEQDGDFAEAGRLYERAARRYESDATAPGYFMNAARNYEAAANYDAARDVYEAIQEDYPSSPQATEIDVYTARLDALAIGS